MQERRATAKRNAVRRELRMRPAGRQSLRVSRAPERRAGIIIARLYDDVDIDRKIMRALHARKVFVAQRFTDNVGGFRISCNWFNTKKDIDNMIEAFKAMIDLIGRAPDYKG